MKTLKKIIIFLFSIFICSCAALDKENTEYLRGDIPESPQKGIYHKVEKGDTLWSIAQAYNVLIDDIVRSNNIPNVAKVEVGQLIFIPGSDTTRTIVISKNENEKDFIWPIKGKVINYFQQRKGNSVNKGIDIESNEGEIVSAARSGKVVLADFMTGYGNTVILDHEDGYYTVYANNSKLLVKLGERIVKNNPIAYAGTKNNISFLHFEIRLNSREENPLFYLP